ncbi:phosphatidylinositol 3,4,5-trisphosphate 3-phosphatase and dual-specificity protein phosphatase PTEN-like [Xenia sp. Carnegie-2017]|uniref:phosphatidylinositol 3,4,5-trisphosphate 3-phosphatase and dual-specificity protein phosphatase PTEN-like n=1 Tax=Xenia sp. Carnegie-2017 TaxID=2897299 RepID=UPI001F03B13A|nr:phosphatidylinositol 3,4,5-trisphosphate 3-phosphatase and dual-specificity protein phosphatase PTEN-like [Xenia sp. Carnegie-2017]
MMDFLKRKVSKQKRRYKEDGFDLDLSYIKPNIVAMGFPSDKIEGVYRNHIDEILRFLEAKHKDHYKIYNLCSEKKYDEGKFNNRVARYRFPDHNAPPFQLMKPYCEDMDEFLNADEKNVAIVHCKAGKGRTGVMICAYLLHKAYFDSCVQAMQYYGDARTSNGKGVTIPSQKRYIHYYSHLLKHELIYKPTTLLITNFIMETIPNISNGTCAPLFHVLQTDVKIFSSKFIESDQRFKNIVFKLPQPLPVCGDIKVQFFCKDRKFGMKDLMFQFWFNTFFVSGLTPQPSEGEASMTTHHDKNENEIEPTSWFELHKEDLDKANKDKKNKIYSPDFKLKVYFIVPGNEKSPNSSDDHDVTNGLHPPVALTPTFLPRERCSPSALPKNFITPSISSASIDSIAGKSCAEDMSDTDSDSEWNRDCRKK